MAEEKTEEIVNTGIVTMTKNDSIYSNINFFADAQRIAKALSASTLIPTEYRNDIPNCLIAMEIGNRLGMTPLMVMQNLFIVKGKPGWSSQYVTGAINSSGKFDGMLKYAMVGEEGTDSWGCYAHTKDKETGETIKGTTITIKMSKDEKWYQKDGSKWKTMPEQMLRYRSATFFGRSYVPEILIGFSTADELEDIGKERKEVKSLNDIKKGLLEESVAGNKSLPSEDVAVKEGETLKNEKPEVLNVDQLTTVYELIGGNDKVQSQLLVQFKVKKVEELINDDYQKVLIFLEAWGKSKK